MRSSLVALAVCLLVAPPSWAINLFSFNRIQHLKDLDLRLAKTVDSNHPQQLSPVILVPGDGGSRIDAELNKTERAEFWCDYTSSQFYDIWLNKEQLAPWDIDCWADNLRLVYNQETRKTSNSPGVKIRFPGWGYAETVEWIDTSHAAVSAYYVNLANVLVQNGYHRGVSIRGAPYDFRKAPNENIHFPIKMRYLVEETYAINNNTPVTLIVHSYGGPMTLNFLHQMTQEWKDKYIKRMISLAGAWGGSVKSLKVYTLGEDFNSKFVRSAPVKLMLTSTPSLAYLMPSPLFWKPDQVLISTAKKTYTVNDYQEFYDAINHPEGWEMYKDVLPYIKNFSPPGVEVQCYYGSDVQTIEKLDYGSSSDLTDSPTLFYGDGDGTVNLQSLEACKNWIGQQDQPVNTTTYPKADHMGILANVDVLRDLITLLAGGK